MSVHRPATAFSPSSQPTTRVPRERRAHRRLPLEVFIEIESLHPPGRVIERAITTDISAGGVRFTSFNWRRLPVGARFRVVVSLPFESVIFTDRRRLAAAATVVRWQEVEGRVGGSAGAGRYRLEPLRRSVALRFDEPLTFVPSP